MLAATLVVAGCKPSGGEHAAAPAHAADPNIVRADPQLERWLKYERLRMEEYHDTVRVPGAVTVDQTRVAQVGANVTRRLTALSVVVGQNVRRGETLAELRSTELAAAQLALLRAKTDHELARASAARGSALLGADVIGELDYKRRTTDLAETEARVAAYLDQLRVLGLSEESLRALVKTRAVSSTSRVVSSIAWSRLDSRTTASLGTTGTRRG